MTQAYRQALREAMHKLEFSLSQQAAKPEELAPARARG